MIKIIADSTCDLSEELIEKYNIGILPLHIVLGENEYNDGTEISPDEIYAWSDKNNKTPKTSAAGIAETMEFLENAKKEAEEIIMFSISENMSTTANVFRMAADELEMADMVSVINSENLSTGIGHLVIEAAIMAESGMKRDDIVAEIEQIKKNVRSSFVVDTLTYLHRGGRCNSIEALAGGALKLHPKIVVQNGSMTSEKKYRGKMDRVIMHYVKDMEEALLKAKKDRVFITHSGCNDDDIKNVYSYLENLHHFDEIHITRAGGVISSHCGPGTLGVLYIE